MRNFWLLVPASVFVTLALSGCGKVKPHGAPPPAPAAAAPELVPIAPEQIRDALSARRGKVVLLNVWASWCLPCKEEFPDLMRVYRELAPRGLELVLVSADFAEQQDAARRFLGSQGVDFPTYLRTGSDEALIDAVDPAWTGALPATLVLGRDGQKKAFWQGTAAYEQFKQAVEPLL